MIQDQAIPALTLKGVYVGHGGAPVVKGVDVEVCSGQIVGLTGPNGGGKTSLLRAICGMAKFVTGDILVGDKNIRRQPPHKVARLGIAHVPEGRGLFTDMKVRDNLYLGAYAVGQEPELETVLSLFPELERTLDASASALSGGEQQMVGIGRALMAKPRILLIDELSMGLAPKITQRIYETLLSVRDLGTAILVVDSNSYELARVTDRLHWINLGQVAHTFVDGGAVAVRNFVKEGALAGKATIDSSTKRYDIT